VNFVPYCAALFFEDLKNVLRIFVLVLYCFQHYAYYLRTCLPATVLSRVARWYVFKPKFPISECLAMKDEGKCYGHLVYFTAISYILWRFGNYVGMSFWYIIPVLVCCTKKNLATLVLS
jgi:hypothetical protein